MSSEPSNESSLFNAARKIQSGDERKAYLREACGGDTALEQRVAELLSAYHEESQFLEKPAPGLEETMAPHASSDDLAASLDAGLVTAFSVNDAVVLGDANHSVLRSLCNTIDEVPRVSLRDSVAEGADPIARPKSPEMPRGDSDSRYQLQGEIARGGMGAIIKGRDTDLGRDLAIKVLLDSHKDKPQVIQRFIEEAQIGGQLQHPGIAPIYELGQFADKRPFFAMKLVKGETLAKLLADREDAADERGKFIGIFEQICQTMAYAHSRGVIHRDLKPANIMVGAFGEVQVMDWGLAKVLPTGGVADEKKAKMLQQGQSIIQTMRSSGSDVPGSFGSSGSETQMGSVMGTPAYMPPEQALGEIDQMNERADVFGLGAILCEILTGKPPYVADDGTQVYRMASRGKLDDCFARLDRCEADAELISLTKHCLEPEPANRPRDAGILAESVSGYLESVETKLRETELAKADAQVRAEELKRRNKLALTAGTAIVATLLIGISVSVWQALRATHAEGLAKNETARATEAEKETAKARDEAEVRAYTASLAAAVADLQRNDSRTLRRRLEQTAVRLRGWEWDYLWNESDRSLETTLTLPPANEGYQMDLSRDGTLVAVRPLGANDKPVTVYDTRTGGQVAVLKTPASNFPRMTFSNDNKLLAYQHWGTPGVQIFEIATGRGLVPKPGDLTNFYGFDPSGERAVVHDGQGKIRVFTTTDWSPVTELPGTFKSEAGVALSQWGSLSPDGTLLVICADGEDSMWVYNLTTNSLVKELPGSIAASVAEFSDDGESVTFLSADGNLVKYSTTDWKQVAATHEAQQDRGDLAVHRLDQHLVGMSFDANGAVALYDINMLTRSATLRGHGSPGSSIAVDVERTEIVTAHRDGAVCRWDLRHPLEFPLDINTKDIAFAPDGASLHAGHIGRPVQTLELGPTTGRTQGMLGWYPVTPKHANITSQLAFSPNGRSLAVATQSGWGHGGLRIYDLWTGLAQHTAESGVGNTTCIDWSPDGKWIAVGGKTYENGGLSRLFDAINHQALETLNDGEGGVNAVSFSRDSQRFVTAADDGTLRSWEVPAGRLLLTIGTPGDPAVTCAVHSPDGRLLVSGSADGTVAAWNPQNGKLVFRAQIHGAAVQSLAFTPDGSRLMSSSVDRSLMVLDPVAWRELLTLHFEEPVRAMSFSPDGRRLALLAGSLVFLETQSEVERSKFRRLRREQNVDAEALLLAALKETTDPIKVRAQLLERTETDESVRGAALERFYTWLGRSSIAAYHLKIDDSRKLQVLRQQIVIRSGQLPTVAQTQQLIAGMTAIQQQALADQTGLFDLATQPTLVSGEFTSIDDDGIDGGKLDTQQFALEIVVNPERSQDDQLLACYGMEPVLRQRPQDPACLMTMALAEYRIGLYADALESAKRGAAGSSNANILASCLAVIAMAQHRMGQTEAAVAALQKLNEAMKGLPGDQDPATVVLADEARQLLASPAEASWDEQAAWNAAKTRAEKVLGPMKPVIWLASLAERRNLQALERGDWEAAAAAYETARSLLETQLTALPADVEVDEVAKALANLLLTATESRTWTVLKPLEMKSQGGATLTLLEDGSILASGKNPDQDAYQVTAKAPLQRVTAIRLEAIPDASLPHNGPGRWPGHGNFHLNEFRVLINGTPHRTEGIVVSFSDPNAREQYRNITDGTIDGNHWSIHPRIGQRHSVTFGADFELTAGDTLTLQLVSSRGTYPQHNLGRFRLSVSNDPSAYANAEQRFAAIKMDDPWAKLAAAYHLIGDQTALDALLEQRPHAAAGIGDLYALDGNWQRAIEEYSKRITDQTTNATLLSKRAAAYIATQQWDLAKADLSRALQKAPESEQAGLAGQLADLLLNSTKQSVTWTVLTPTEMKSAGNATLTLQADRSILVSGANVSGDLYTLSAVSPVDSIAAVRLEALPDASLPHNGPGRHSSGNFQLSEFRIQLRTGDGATDLTPLRIESARASFDYKASDAGIAGTIDESLNKVWHVWGRFGNAHQAIFRLKSTSTTNKDAPVVVELRHQGFDQGINLGRFRLSVSADPGAYVNTEKRFNAMNLTDPWAKLAAVYHVVGDQQALERLLEQHPQSAQGIGDLYALDGNWQRAIEEYSKRITDQTTNATLLSKRAAAYIATQQWELAKADWLRVIEQQPDQLQTAFDEFKKENRWSEAAEFGLKLIAQNPDADSGQWLATSAIVALAENQTAYADLCGEMILKFADSESIEDAERTVKSCLLMSNVIAPDKLPADKFTSSLDDGTAPAGFLSWGWSTRALLAWRSGDAGLALKYVAKSEESGPQEVTHAANLTLVATAQHQLQRPDQARAALAEASQLIARLKQDSGIGNNHDLLIAEILFREAEALIMARVEASK